MKTTFFSKLPPASKNCLAGVRCIKSNVLARPCKKCIVVEHFWQYHWFSVLLSLLESSEHLLNCSFECGVGFFLNGEQMSQCTDDDDGDAAGVWDRPAPSCEQILCLPGHTDPTNGNVACSNGNLFASVCQ